MAQWELCRNAMWNVAAQWLPRNCADDESTVPDQQGNGDIEMDIPDGFDSPQPDFDLPHQSPPSANAGHRDQPDRRAQVEEIEDEEAGGLHQWVEDYPRPTGVAGQPAKSYFEEIRARQEKMGEDLWAPFDDQEEWELAQWLMLNVGQNATDKFLKLPIVSDINRKDKPKVKIDTQTHNRTQPSFKNKCIFYNRIDNLPCGTQWECEVFEIEGDELDERGLKRKETLHLWKHDPVECIRELIGNPAFRNQM